MSNISIVNAVINSAEICVSRGFILDSWVHLNFGDSGQGFGGYALGGMPFQDTALSNGSQENAGEWIRHVMAIADVEKWSDLKGKTIRVKVENAGLGQNILGIGHIVKDRWFEPKKVFSANKDKASAQ